MESVSDYVLMEEMDDFVTYVKEGVASRLAREMVLAGFSDFVVSVLPPTKGDYFNTEFVAVAIPGEYKRLTDRIAELEAKIRISGLDRWRPTAYDD
jgi:hypothetical protein